MADSPRDNNRETVLMGISSVDGVTPVAVVVDSVTNRVCIQQSSMSAPVPVTNREVAVRDGNREPVMLGVSSDDDGVLVMPIMEGTNLRLKQL